MSCCKRRTVAVNSQVASIACEAVLETMAEGQEKYGDGWRVRVDSDDFEHIRAHLDKFESGDTTEPHIEHALTRLAFILARRARAASSLKSTAIQ